MATKYVLLAFNGDHQGANHVKIFINRLTKLEKLQNDKLQAKETIRNQ
jgi:hypothetical protein